MSVLSFGVGDLFVFRVIKHLSTNPDNSWANSYEFRSNGAGDNTELETLATILILFEVALHYTNVQFDHVLISTWAADSVPYDPEAFMSIPQSVSGGVTATTDPLALNNALSVRRVPTSGRFGHIFLRGCISEGDVTAPAGKTVLDSPSSIQTRVDDASSDSELETYIGAAVEAPLEMVMIDRSGTVVRPVVGLVVAGMSSLPLDHAWFNRTTT